MKVFTSSSRLISPFSTRCIRATPTKVLLIEAIFITVFGVNGFFVWISELFYLILIDFCYQGSWIFAATYAQHHPMIREIEKMHRHLVISR